MYECTPGYQVNTGIENDERVLLEYKFTCGANNDWKDQYSPDHCKKQSCGDPGLPESGLLYFCCFEFGRLG